MDEEIQSAKHPWEKPELIVLVRSRPEEAVLLVCKFDGDLIGTAGTLNTGCNTKPIGFCSHCSTKTNS
jgi:hypothetical protein